MITRDDQLRHAGEMMIAMADGKHVETTGGYRYRPEDVGDTTGLGFFAGLRIKPEPTYRPWTEAEIEAECINGTVIKSKPQHDRGRRVGPMSLDGDRLMVGSVFIGVLDDDVGAWLLDNYVIAATGAPCGVLE